MKVTPDAHKRVTGSTSKGKDAAAGYSGTAAESPSSGGENTTMENVVVSRRQITRDTRRLIEEDEIDAAKDVQTDILLEKAKVVGLRKYYNLNRSRMS